MKNTEYIEIPKSWLEGLLALSEKSEKDNAKENMWILIGYISSINTILKIPRKSDPTSH